MCRAAPSVWASLRVVAWNGKWPAEMASFQHNRQRLGDHRCRPLSGIDKVLEKKRWRLRVSGSVILPMGLQLCVSPSVHFVAAVFPSSEASKKAGHLGEIGPEHRLGDQVSE